MKVHVFGNTSPPAVATFCLRRTADVEESVFGSDAKEFVRNNFYIKDGLKSVADTTKAIDLLSHTQAMLARSNLYLHKIASNHPEMTEAFPAHGGRKLCLQVDFSPDVIPVQHSLGVLWDLSADALTSKRSHSRAGVHRPSSTA